MNWKKSLKELCDPNPEVVKRRLRRIHLRWYHASAPAMTRILAMIGCPDSAIHMVRDVVATCRVCRTWTRKAPDTKIAVRLSIRFNQRVQVDLMFYECAATPLGGNASSSVRPPPNHIVLHIVDECIRWSVAIEIAGNTPEDIIDAIVTHWFKVYGKPELMIWDGERAMVSIGGASMGITQYSATDPKSKAQESMGLGAAQ